MSGLAKKKMLGSIKFHHFMWGETLSGSAHTIWCFFSPTLLAISEEVGSSPHMLHDIVIGFMGRCDIHAEETALIRTRPSREDELQFSWMPYKFPAETQEVPLRHIFRLRGKDKAKMVVQQIMQL